MGANAYQIGIDPVGIIDDSLFNIGVIIDVQGMLVDVEIADKVVHDPFGDYRGFETVRRVDHHQVKVGVKKVGEIDQFLERLFDL